MSYFISKMNFENITVWLIYYIFSFKNYTLVTYAHKGQTNKHTKYPKTRKTTPTDTFTINGPK